MFEIINIGDSFISVNFIEKKINLFEVSKQLEKSKIKEIDDIVYSNSSIGIEYDSDKTNYKTISDKINNHLQSLKINSNKFFSSYDKFVIFNENLFFGRQPLPAIQLHPWQMERAFPKISFERH